MKTTTNQETISLDTIEKNTVQILKKLGNFKPGFFKRSLKFSKKAEAEKIYLFKSLVPKRTSMITQTSKLFDEILANPKFSKLGQEDQDFILELEKLGFKDSQYIREINEYIATAADTEEYFSTIMEENLYFNFLYSELSDIQLKMLKIDLI